MCLHIFNRSRKPPENGADAHAGVLLGEKSAFAYQEAYRVARTNLLYLPIEDRCRKIAVTSAVPAEGKSTVSANLAISLAMAGKRVLIIDMDMRKPVQNMMFRKPRGPGLSEFLAGLDEAPSVQQTEYEGLSLLASGRIPKNPAELMLSKRMDALFGRLEQDYDYILVDTPPIAIVTDATLVAKHVHGYILSARGRYSKTDGVQRAAATLREANVPVYGVILNGLNPKDGRYGGYRYYGRYKRYGKSGYYSSYGGEDA